MDDFSTFARDFGLRPQGKAAPTTRSDGPVKSTSSFSEFDYDSIFNNRNNKNRDNNNSNDTAYKPVYDKAVYGEEDILNGLPGVKSKSGSASVSYDENVFATMSDNRNHGIEFHDLLGNLGRSEKLESKSEKGSKGFDDLLPGFGASSPQRSSRSGSEFSQSQKTSVNSTKPITSIVDDPFDVLQSTPAPTNSSSKVFVDPLDEIGKLGNFANKKTSRSSVSGPVYDDIDPLDGFGKSAPALSSEINKEHGPSRAVSSDDRTQSTLRTEPTGKSSFRNSSGQSQKMPDDNFQELHQTMFDIPSVSTGSRKSVGQMASQPYVNAEFKELNSDIDASPRSDEQLGSSDDAWLTVSDIPLFTQPKTAPPPSRPPPPIPGRPIKSETGFYQSNSRKKGNEFSSYHSYSEYSQSPKPSRHTVNNNMSSPIDELESFAMGRTRQSNDESADTHGSEEMETNSSAAASASAMKEAMDRAEAKFRHAKEVREREYAKTARNRESVNVEKDEQVMSDEQERDYRENEERLECERRQREEEEECRRLEREREREEREKARQAVQRATREARKRAAIEARERAAAETRRKSERAAVERAQAEARERAERAAVQRAQAEVRERAAADAKEKAEKAVAEARERGNAEARDKAAANARAEAEAQRKSDRAAVDRAAAEARERAASAAWTNQQKNDNARMNEQQKNDNDLESFFNMNSRPSSAPRPRDPMVDPLFQSKVGSEATKRTSSVNTSANMKKTSSATSFVDDLSSIFGGSASSGDFQEVEGETGERRKARLDRHQRTQERATKALAEKNQRDLQCQREQEERSRIGETLDIEVKRWAAGKEGNLRALLSTLQYVLWPECGWTPVSLTDLITGASVKKVYRKATLCIHPDKVQQKGANLQQKYIAEKVFDLLKEAWNKFNSEELF